MKLTATHRAFFYWLLLLVPTLAIGAGALWLLRREQTRINQTSRSVDIKRNDAVRARTRLIAENIGVIFADAKTKLAETLAEAPGDGPATFLLNWKKSNPLVYEVVQSTNDGRLRWGKSGEEINAWLRTTPWKKTAGSEPETPAKQPPPASSQRKFSKSADAAEESSTANISQYSVSKNRIQELASRNINLTPTSANETDFQIAEHVGWSPFRDTAGALHLFAWRLCANKTVLVVEINLPALASHFAGVLPEKIDNDEFYVLRAGADIIREVGFFEKDNTPGTPEISVPVSADTLPDWTVSGYLNSRSKYGVNGSGNDFFITSALLVGLSVLTILAGGALLLRQARRSEAESMQKTSFVANVSHELKTPLTSIRLHAELLEQNRVRDDRQRGEFLRAIGRETQRLTRLVNNVLDFSRLEQGRKVFSKTSFDLCNELAQLLDRHASRIADAGIKLERDFPPVPVVVESDCDAIEQIVLNLIDNACKYAAGGGELLVSLKQNSGTGAGAEIRFSDRGPGIPAAQREKIFEKFHRIDNTLTAEHGGAGLGLSIARQLARGLGGDLFCEARAGGGSVFILNVAQSERLLKES